MNATFGRWFREPAQAGAYLQRLRETVARFEEYDLVLYQPGPMCMSTILWAAC